ncbi:MAG: hypothetical protein Q8S20_16930 [Sulfuritalea sp.]|nr:hypothetical protein [Sulfuritalea sp.]
MDYLATEHHAGRAHVAMAHDLPQISDFFQRDLDAFGLYGFSDGFSMFWHWHRRRQGL